MTRLKATCQEIINELRLNLDPSALEELRAIEKSLKEAANSDDFLAVRKAILNLIKAYISRISKEREEAASFIREIGERLIEVEGHMINSLSFAKDAHQVSSSFTDTLEGQLVEFKQTIDISRDLSELKTAVASRLSSIKTVLENKRQDDSVRLQQADQQMQQLQQNLTEMKGEIQTAWQRAKSLERELLIDPLTGIYNRRAYDRRIMEETERYQRYQRAFSMLIFDVDHFKRVNDLYGHSVGDMCLKEIVHRIKPVLRKSDFMARYGGEEFAVIVPETRSAGALDVAEKLRQTVEATKFIYKTNSVAITVSVGVTEIVPADKTPEDIFTRADRALYNAKQGGRNRVSVL
jgi:diguanylate cyclase (GGDEF)-like protein